MRFRALARRLALTIPAIAVATAGAARADTAVEQSCRLLAVLGGNQAEQVAPTLADLAARWVEENRVGVSQRLSGMLAEVSFAGGNVYQLGRLGDDLVEHLVVLRLEDGETAGLQLVYEWTPDGLALTRLNFKLDYASEPGITRPARLEPEACP